MKNTRSLPLMMISIPLLACSCVLFAMQTPFGGKAGITALGLSLLNAIVSLVIIQQAEKAEAKNAITLVLLGKGIKAALILATLALYMILLPKANRMQLIFPFGAAYMSVLLMETFIKTKKNPINLKEKVLS